MALTEMRRNSPRQPWTYAQLDAHQKRIAAEILAGGTGKTVLSELAPVITLGKRASPDELSLPPVKLADFGIEVLRTERGGLATYHGPGQWVLFVIDRLDRLTGDRRGVRKAVEALLEIALQVGLQFDPSCEIRTGTETGVWNCRGKFASVGVQIRQGILQHGLSVNGFQTDLSFMGLARPCGLAKPVSFLLNTPGIGWGHPGLDRDFMQLGRRILNEASRCFPDENPAGASASALTTDPRNAIPETQSFIGA